MSSRHLSMLFCLVFVFSISNSVWAKRAGFSGLSAMADAPDTAFWNPAGITRLEHSAQAQATLAFLNADFKVESSTFDGGDPHAENDLLLIPGAYYVRPLNEQWYASFSLSVPSGIGSDYGSRWAGRYHSQETSLVFLSLNPSLAYKVNEELSLSFGLAGMYVDSVNKLRVNNILLPQDGYIKLEEDGSGVGYTLSALYQPRPDTRFGFSYKSEINPDLEGIPEFSGIDELYILALSAEGLLGKKVNTDFTIPQFANVGAFHQLNKQFSFTADAMWVDMSEFGIRKVDVGSVALSPPQNFRDIYGGSLGMAYQFDERTRFSFGFVYLRSPYKSARDRTLELSFDRTKAIGFGIERTLDSGDILDIKLDIADQGDSRIDLEGNALTGELKGHYAAQYAILLDLNYRFAL